MLWIEAITVAAPVTAAMSTEAAAWCSSSHPMVKHPRVVQAAGMTALSIMGYISVDMSTIIADGMGGA